MYAGLRSLGLGRVFSPTLYRGTAFVLRPACVHAEASFAVRMSQLPVGAGAPKPFATRGLTTSTPRRARFPREVTFMLMKGLYGRAKKSMKIAFPLLMKKLYRNYMLRTRRRRGHFRSMWITRINAASREHGVKYGEFRDGLKRATVVIDRKMLCALAQTEPASFKVLVDEAKRYGKVERTHKRDISDL
mmetsp:Transcript_62207/g.143225  ORF Transcript_62207/g.143225 Transcript_62207/m.143225 type:complete len:189 (-) Transcript_62207:45-611(-)